MDLGNLNLLSQPFGLLLEYLQGIIGIIQQENDIEFLITFEKLNKYRELLRNPRHSSEVKLNVLKILNHFAEKSVDKRKKIVNAGLLPLIINVLKSYKRNEYRQITLKLLINNLLKYIPKKTSDELSIHDKALIKEAAELISIIIDGNATYRDVTIELGLIKILISLTRDDRLPVSFIHCTLIALIERVIHICEQRVAVNVIKVIVPILSNLIQDLSLAVDILQMLTQLVDDDSFNIQILLHNDIHLLAIELLENNEAYIKIEALNVLRKLTMERSSLTITLLDKGLLDNLCSLLTYDDCFVRLTALQCMSNVINHLNVSQIKSLFSCSFLQGIVVNLNHMNIEIVRETAVILRNLIIFGSKDHLRCFYHSIGIPRLLELMDSVDSTIASAAQEAMQHLASVLL